MATLVIVKKVTDYDRRLKSDVEEILERFVGSRIYPGAKVLVKPNLLAPAAPERAIVTHPLIVRTVVEWALARGAVVQVSDSPGTGSFKRVIRASGLLNALQSLSVDLREFDRSVPVSVKEPFSRLELAEDALRADFVINLAKLKTHSQMLLTLGVKNLFGCVVGLGKPRWHMKTGVDRDLFAKLLVRIYEAVNPAVTILDGILAMEGQGPGQSGSPRLLRVLMGSDDAVAVDVTVCKMIGIDPDMLLTNRAARELGLRGGEIIMEGDLPHVKDFKLPEMSSLLFGPPRFHSLFRKNLIQRPVVNAEKCRTCGECWEYCPTHAITRHQQAVSFDYDRCIRCYCCLEICPEGAIETSEPFLGKVVRQLSGGRWSG